MPTPSPATLSAGTIRRALGEFQIAVNDSQVLQIQQYMSILLTWNEKINLTAIRDPLEILNRHFCECMYAAATVPVTVGRLADVGSGAGFPGLPLKIIRPELDVVLIESNVKKATFLAEVIRDLGLRGARVGLLGKSCRKTGYPLDWGQGPARNRKDTVLGVARAHPGATFVEAAPFSRHEKNPARRRADLIRCNSSNLELPGSRALFHVKRSQQCSTWNICSRRCSL